MLGVSLNEVAILLAALAIAGPLARWLGISAVLGYLVVGMVLGPHTIGWSFTDYKAQEILHFAEFGIVLLLFLILGFGFSGYLLPWNQLSFFATKVGTDIAGAVPLVGEWMLRFLRGGDRVTGSTLSRFYGWHVAILPAITVAVLSVHLLLVQIKGMSVPAIAEEDAKRRAPMKFFPHFALRDLSGWIFALGVLAALAAMLPWELGEKADPFAPAYANIRPEWYYVFMFQALKLVPGGEVLGVEYEAIPIMLFGLAGLALLLVPFLDRRAAREGRSPGWTIAGILGLIFVIAMTCWGYASLVPLYIVFISILLLAVFAFITRGTKETR